MIILPAGTPQSSSRYHGKKLHGFAISVAWHRQVRTILASLEHVLHFALPPFGFFLKSNCSTSLADSSVFEILSMPEAASIKVSRSPNSIIFAGEPFHTQPACKVLDARGNTIDSAAYNVQLTITNSQDQGCLCDTSAGDDCKVALSIPTVQKCPKGKPDVATLRTSKQNMLKALLTFD